MERPNLGPFQTWIRQLRTFGGRRPTTLNSTCPGITIDADAAPDHVLKALSRLPEHYEPGAFAALMVRRAA